MNNVQLLLVTCGLLTAPVIHGQADICNTATPITCGAVVNGNTTGFAPDVAPFCGTGDSPSGGVWFRFAGNGQNVTATLCPSAFDTRIRVYSGTCASLQCVAGNDDGCASRSQVTWSSQTGYNYFILVHGFGTAVGPFNLSLTCAAPAPLCYVTTPTSFMADPFTGTQVILGDDWHSALVPIGFPFCFNGMMYNQCVISSNNFISFNAGTANTYSPWVTVPIPNLSPSTQHNTIMAPWQDIHPGVGGQIRYQTLGTAPNRRFVVSYWNIPMFSCVQQIYTSQTVLYENSNCIGTYITTKPICTTWNSGRAVHGVQNGNASSAVSVGGRNNTQWTATNQGMFFTPICAPCSTAASSQCIAILLPVELMNFQARLEGGRTRLEWATATEHNAKEFIVECSSKLDTFRTVAVVPAAGSSQSTIQYSAEDRFPAEGMNYYRLRMVDLDGSESFSDMVPVELIDEDRPLIYPNPAQDVVHLRLPRRNWTETRITIRDMLGREVRSLVIDGWLTKLTLAGFKPGTYVLEVPSLGPVATTTFQVL